MVQNDRMSTFTPASIGQYLTGMATAQPNTSKPVQFFNKTPTVNKTNIQPSSIYRIIAYILAIIIVILIILIFIHFFITPIFRLRPGTSGIIPIPGYDDGSLFWNTTSAGTIENSSLGTISNLSFGYTMNLDMFIQNPLQFATRPRLLFSRGATMRQTPTGSTLIGLMSTYNLAIALQPDTNDLIVSVLDSNTHQQDVIIRNAPVQQPFRIGIVVMQQALEVYLNGELVGTRVFPAVPASVTGNIMIASGQEATIAILKNLKIWPRILTTSEIRYATPALPSASAFGASPMTSSSSCAASSLSAAASAAGNAVGLAQAGDVLDYASRMMTPTSIVGPSS